MQLLPAQLKDSCSYVRLTASKPFSPQPLTGFPIPVAIKVAVALHE